MISCKHCFPLTTNKHIVCARCLISMCCVDRKLANYQEAEWSSASGLEKHYQELEAHYSSAEGGAPLHVYLTSYTMYNTVCTSSYLTLPRK